MRIHTLPFAFSGIEACPEQSLCYFFLYGCITYQVNSLDPIQKTRKILCNRKILTSWTEQFIKQTNKHTLTKLSFQGAKRKYFSCVARTFSSHSWKYLLKQIGIVHKNKEYFNKWRSSDFIPEITGIEDCTTGSEFWSPFLKFNEEGKFDLWAVFLEHNQYVLSLYISKFSVLVYCHQLNINRTVLIYLKWRSDPFIFPLFWVSS